MLTPVMPLITSLIILAIFLLVAIVAKALIRSPAPKALLPNSPTETFPEVYEPYSSILTPAERSFFGVLEHALGEQQRLFAKVRLADVIRPAPNPSRSGYQSALNRITSKHVDFVLCDRATLKILAAIELDDKSHSGFERGFRDTFLAEALSSAGIPLVRFSARHSYSTNELRDKIAAMIHPKTPIR